MPATILIAADFRAIGLTVFSILMLAFIALWIRNMFAARDELGSEIEVAPNRKQYLSDEELEGPKLDLSLSFALVVLGLVAVALPFYWLAEPGRQDGAVQAYETNFISRGEGTYTVGAQCVNCHSAGGIGGAKDYVLQDADGQFITNAFWTAPALNNVMLRYSFEEVEYILNYGRPGSPMAAWGTPGGGPLTEQQVSSVIKYIETLQVATLDPIEIAESDDPVAAQAAADEISAGIYEEVERSMADGEFDSLGEAVFNLGLFSGYQAGSLSCARCHTSGWSLGSSVFPNLLDEGVAGCGGGSPSGIGFSLCGDGLEDRFPDDTWKRPDGTWNPVGGSDIGDGQKGYEAMDGTIIPVDAKGNLVTDRTDESGELISYLILTDDEHNGDVADCEFVSSLWEPGGRVADSYPYNPLVELVVDDGLGTDVTQGFYDPEELTVANVEAMSLGGEVVVLEDGRIGGGCTVIDMPERTSQSHFDFIYSGSNAGAAYGVGGQGSGKMPGFGGTLPADLIQAVVDYERGL